MLDSVAATDAPGLPRRTRPTRPVTHTQRVLTAKQAAREYGITYSELRALAFAGRVPVVRFSDSPYARWFFDRSDLEALVTKHKAVLA